MKRKHKTPIWKRAITVVFTLAMTMGMATIALATDTPVAAQPGDFRTATTNTNARSNFDYGECRFTYHGNYVTEVYAYTSASAYIDKVVTIAILERLYNGSWQIYDLKQVTESNAIDAVSVMYTEVPGGYYYRGRSVHITTHNNDETRKELVTDSLWVAR